MISSSRKALALMCFGILLILVACQGTAEEQSSEEESHDGDDITEIVGIEPGSGTMDISQNAVDEYDLDLELTPSSEPAMVTELQSAIENEEPIIVTLWQPHWTFSEYDLKFLEDPKETLGESENIHTMVRQGLEEDHPSAYELLDNFYWDVEDMNEVMAKFGQDDSIEPRDAAAEWIDDHPDKVNAWTESIEPVNGDTIELAYVNWDTELSSTNVVALVLEDLGYNVELTPLDMGIAFESLANSEIDGMLIAWLPVGAAAYSEQYEDEIVDLGPNLEGAQQGFVVPAYMDIDSIEDLPVK